MGLLSPSWAQEFSLDGFRTCARADNGNHYCKTSASANWTRVTPEFFNRFKQAEAEGAAGGSGQNRDLQEVADFLNDLSQYLKERAADGSPANLGEIARAVVATKAAVDVQNLTEARNGKRRIEVLFKADPTFVVFMKRLADERQQVIDRRMAEAALEVSKHLAFIDAYVAGNILSPHVSDLTRFKEQFSKVLKERILGALNRAHTEFARFVADKRLADEYRSVMLAWTEKNTPKAADDPSSTLAKELGITDKTRFLIEGHNEELILLYNTASGRIVKSLRGDLVFKSREARICFAQDRSAERVKDLERLTMAQVQRQEFDVRSVTISQSACPIQGMEGFDVLVFQRVGLLSQAPDYVSSLVRLAETKFSLLASLPGPEVVQAFKNEAGNSATVEAQILGGKSTGFGLVYTNPSQARICHTVPEDAEAHQVAVLRKANVIFNVGTDDIRFSKLSLDDAFADYQTRKCNAIYGSAEDLAGLIKALKRERLDYVVARMWVEPLEISAILKAEAIRMANLMAKEEEARKALQEEATILRQRLLDEVAKRESIERGLQARNGNFARAAQDRITTIVDTFINEVKAGGDRRGDGVNGRAAELFFGFTQFYKRMVKDRWELETKSYAVEDFGDVDWKSRKLEAVIVRAEFTMQNQMLGRRDKMCFLLGAIVDAEFSYLRDAITLPCKDAESEVVRWQVGAKFSSRWRAASN